MSTSYTSLLGLALPVTGELSGTWGSMVDNAITSPIDIAVAGTQSITGDSNVTLSVTNGDSAGTNLAQVGSGTTGSAQYAIILCTGARTALRTITAPAASKIYTVINATTGGFSVKLVGSGPTTGLTIPNGASAVVAWNGSDFIEIGSASVGNFTVNGNLTVTGTSTLTGAVTNTAGTANGVAYLNGSKVLTTGSALTFDGANTLNMGATNASSYNTVAINNPSATGYARMLLQIGSSGATGVGAISYAPGIFFKIGTETDTLSTPMTFLLGNGSEQMRLTSTGLGIGTSSPTVKLDVSVGNVNFSNTAQVTQLISSSTTAGNQPTLSFQHAGNNTFSIKGGSNLQFYSDNTTNLRMTLDNSGNLGLGVTPSAWSGYGLPIMELPNNGTIVAAGSGQYLGANWFWSSGFKYKTSDFASYAQQISGQFRWFNAPSGTAGDAITFTQAMTLDASGNLGIGTTTPGAKLDVVGGVLVRYRLANGGIGNTGSTSGNWFYIGNIYLTDSFSATLRLDGTQGYSSGSPIAGSTYIHLRGSNANSIIEGFFYGVTQGNNQVLAVAYKATAIKNFDLWVKLQDFSSAVVYCDTNGIYIPASTDTGSTTQPAGSTSLGSLWSASTSGVERARIDSGGNLLVGTTTVGVWGNGGFGVQINGGGTFTVTGHGSGTSSGTGFAYFDYANSPIGSITQSGTTAVLYNVTSDQRLKENIIDAPEFGSVIDSLQVRSFDWKTDHTHQRAGFVAQELVTVAPEAVHQPTDPEEMMAVDYSKLVPMLVKEIQSLRKRLADAGI